MPIGTINIMIADLTVKMNSIKEQPLNIDRVDTFDKVLDGIDQLLNGIQGGEYSIEEKPQVVGILRGPVTSLIDSCKQYNNKISNFIIEYQNEQIKAEAQQAFDARTETESNTFEDSLNNAPEETNTQQINRMQEKTKTLILNNTGNSQTSMAA